MYEIFSQISNYISQPLISLGLDTKGVPLFSAFILGIVGALAPCQFTGNLGAITIFGNQSIQKRTAWAEVLFFILGKIVVFTGLGLLVWILGVEIKTSLTAYFPWFRKIVGPLFILIGLFLFGVIKFHKSFTLGSIPEKLQKKGPLGAFFMGVSFTLGFCPTMFVLFFITLMPMAMAVSYGPVLPAIFAIGTSLPLIMAIFLIWYFGLGGKLMKKKGRKLGSGVQKVTGALMLLLGILDTITYWSI
ncbi:sulfite exporter TauE/SafE family protein [Bacillus sp. ISL-47]|uniref:urease accessory protein UreH domain-containing protein n=1 Tax=Bacillus sp. ISL-47 TaxID=2819130 RepID=UPI001BE62463|nr:sulfite exporter TauE/SafE family protein [Bacillus sp. ISL-47]MBT2690909.1 sulfite exporter TauE/SafE family protein [Bacillus sp. ISL-47]MBT2710669.1 sulfite exporter TauE/SafE family protein [Pseudomonas sp. ISL-84]